MTRVRSTGSSRLTISNSLIARFLPLNLTKLMDALLLSSFPPKNGKKDNTAFCASTADDPPEAHHSENAREYVIGKVVPLRVGRAGVDVVVAAMIIRFESRFETSSALEMLDDFYTRLYTRSSSECWVATWREAVLARQPV
jgi:hypothetical protein